MTRSAPLSSGGQTLRDKALNRARRVLLEHRESTGIVWRLVFRVWGSFNLLGSRTLDRGILLRHHRAIYIPVTKVACSSLKTWCAQLNGIGEPPEGVSIHALRQPTVRRDEVLSGYRDHFRFAFVRNPWDRVVSMYANKIADKAQGGPGTVGGMPNWMIPFVQFHRGMGFEAFVEAIATTPDERANEHFVSQTAFLHDSRDRPIAEFIGRFERLDEGLETISGRIGVGRIRLPHLVRSRSRSSDYKDFYTARSRELVAERYGEDVERFGYLY